MKHVTSSRRQLVMGTLLGLAVLGAAMRYWAPDPSLARDVGTLLLVLWLPAVGNLIAFLVRHWQLRRRRHPGQFETGRAFECHLAVRLSPLRPQGSQPASAGANDRLCTLVIGNEGFTARSAVPLAQLFAFAGTPQEVDLELLRPELALRRLAPGTAFGLLAGRQTIAQGTVVRVPQRV